MPLLSTPHPTVVDSVPVVISDIMLLLFFSKLKATPVNSVNIMSCVSHFHLNFDLRCDTGQNKMHSERAKRSTLCDQSLK